MKTLETPRLIIRPFTLMDLPSFYNYASKTTIGPHAGWKPHESIDESQAILTKFVNSEEVWALTLKKSGQLVGSIGIHEDVHRRNPKVKAIGFVLDDEYWGQGLITEAARRIIAYAFDELGIEMVSATHYPYNERSKRVIEKCGLHYEATIKMATVRYDGVILDEMLYTLTREEYYKSKKSF